VTARSQIAAVSESVPLEGDYIRTILMKVVKGIIAGSRKGKTESRIRYE